ncbi:conjugative transfer protein MobI(A/C) [Klebsiella michiganensis]|uniref:conjugative transfer protein MobI(A/C) n=2 Tax=Klebsiella/Raoultella group TaxID=2890311 RepID=UPI001D0E4B25|nr:conjugative transfer protein MobI(A/C) [Klebsiella michiganensis]MCK2103768.1 hypothetical protein [Klebsiella michiganensis]MDU1380553.1 conjugative transfer protein MobI(A/C) [Klebsiella michiganensis]WAT43079.1 conjugative transfer protein MobI(A/C) [Klebsiella michiganensis]
MAGLDAYTFISTFFANSYLCIRVPITGSQKSYFSHLHGCVEWFSGDGTHTVRATGRGCWTSSQESYFFANDMSTKKLKKNPNTLVSLENSFWIPVVCVAGGVDMNPIITAHQEIVIENSVRYIELLKSEASKILDEYWEAWKARNQLISQTTYANGGRFISGRFAPVLRKVESSQKLTIVWKDFSPRLKNKIKHHGVVVKPKLIGYSVSCFKNTLDWELEMIQETEKKLNQSVNYSRNTINENWPASKDWKN